jgi:MFS family permease
MHFFAAFYFVLVLPLEAEWGVAYHELVELWTLGALMVGAVALPAGWLADRWSAPGMMAVMFLGLGGMALAGAHAEGPAELRWVLAGIGVFAAIYHPVGVAWVVRTATARGKALGINGIFGSLGIAGSGLVTGVLIDVGGWRTALLIPGAISILTGLLLMGLMRAGLVRDAAPVASTQAEPSRSEMALGFGLLVFTMGSIGFVFNATQTSLPKLFATRVPILAGAGAMGIGTVVALVYFVSGATQILGGHLADRLPLKHVYLGGLLALAPVQLLMARTGGLGLLAAATTSAFLVAAVLPAENLLLARYSPARHHGLAYAVKFVVAFGAAPLAVQAVARIQQATGGFEWVFLSLAVLAVLATASASQLPGVPPATAGVEASPRRSSSAV